MKEFAKKVKDRAVEYGSIPFWSWNDKLEKEELVRQIRDMKNMEMHGFFMHARGGLQTEYMSDEWFDCIKTCIDEAKALGMEAWSYDENGWPSGFAGGKLLEDEDNFAVFVEGETVSEFPELSPDIYAVYAFDSTGIPYVAEKAIDGCDKYLVVKVGTDSSYVDVMRADVVEKFINETHEVYKKRLGDDFGKAMPGFFTDEPQYYRWKTPFSKKMNDWFIENYNYPVIEALPALFCDYEGADEYRYDYHRITAKMFTEGFSKTLYNWHEKNGVLLTGHFVEESVLNGQMMGCGDIMPQYLYEHIPGMDYLGRALTSDVGPKQLGSVCAQTGRKKVLSEMFGTCGWDVSPRELKSIAELQYANGINLTCQHLYPYSIKGIRKRDYPAFFSEHNKWQSDMKDFNIYFNHLGAMLSMGKEHANVLVIHPMHSAWLKFQREKMFSCITELDKNFAALTDMLSGNQIPYHFGSETIMADLACVKGNVISVGICDYDTVIVPALDTLDSSTVKLLSEYKKNGGKIYTFMGHLPGRIDGRIADISFLEDCEDVSVPSVLEKLKASGEIKVVGAALPEIRMMVRKTEFGRLIYLANLSDKDFYNIAISVKNCKNMCAIDIASLAASSLRAKTTDISDLELLVDLTARAGIVLLESEECAPARYELTAPKETLKLDKLEPVSLPENMMALDRACVSLDGKPFGKLQPLEQIRDELLQMRFNGQLTLRFPFEIKELPKTLKVITEPFNSDSVRVNGVDVKIGEDFAIDRSFRVTDIAKCLKVGENYIDMTFRYWQRDYIYYVLYGGVSETLRNCLVFDTELENIYLVGDFRLDMKKENFTNEPNNAYRYSADLGMSLIGQRPSLDASDIVLDGYPFYCGSVSFVSKLDYKPGDPTLLRLEGRYATAHISVNGKPVGKLIFDKQIDLKDYLSEGENEISITLFNNYRNLLGPHHFHVAEPINLNPRTFSFEGAWKDGVPSTFNGNYAFVRFGINL